MTKPTSGRGTRRQFLKRAAAAGGVLAAAPYAITSTALGARGKPPASDRITVGFIGLGGHGIARNLNGFLGQKDAQPVALCDVDKARIEVGLKTCRSRLGESFNCPTTQDWRQVVDRPDIDAVMISTPDHWHVPISLAALRRGKDVICEKPTFSIAEGRLLADTVKRYGAVYQTSTEDRSIPIYHRMAELVRNGRLGKLQKIYVQLPGGSGPADPTPKPVPEGLDWDMWLGPAPWAPYRAGLHMAAWRGKRDYSGGTLTDWGAHQLDTAQLANDTERTGPIEIEGTGKRHPSGLYDAYYEYHIVYRYANGVEMHVDSTGTGLKFEGTEGWVGNGGWCQPLKASSEKILQSKIEPGEIHLFTCPAGEHRNFLDCVKSRQDPYFPAEVGHRCCSVAHVGNIVMDLGRKLRWDPVKEEFPGEDVANRLRGRAMREPWGLNL